MISYTSLEMKKRTFFVHSLFNSPLINSSHGKARKLKVLAQFTKLKAAKTCRCVYTSWHVCCFISGDISNPSFPLERSSPLRFLCGHEARRWWQLTICWTVPNSNCSITELNWAATRPDGPVHGGLASACWSNVHCAIVMSRHKDNFGRFGLKYVLP